MHVDYCSSKHKNGKIYHSVLLRHTYRITKDKVKHKTILNLTKFPKEEIEAIDWALKHKKELPEISKLKITRKTAKRFGVVFLVKEIIKKMSIDKALGNKTDGKLAQFQLISRVINQGSRLSAIRMASQQATCEVLGIEEETTEDSLYRNLSWLMKKQRSIEQKLYKNRYKTKPEIFLYDVTSSYFEGTHNALADWGYNRDKKKGKMQVVAGLLCDETGNPLAIRLFKGNTLDNNTVHEQIKQLAEEFGSQRVTFVGDRGMIKSKQIEELESNDFYYITAITKPQIETLLNKSVISMGLFDSDLKEVFHEGIRYILKRNPLRAEELSRIRLQKKAKAEYYCQMKNKYLSEHSRAKPETAIKEINGKLKKLKIDRWLRVEIASDKDREMFLIENVEELKLESQFDGCYVIKSNLPIEVSKEVVHDRYKDLKYVEQGFRCMKTDWLEMRPWYVRTEDSTRGHAFIVMLSYMVIKYLKEVWQSEDMTVEEGIKLLDGLSLLEVQLNGNVKYYELPEPSEMMLKLLNLAGVKLPQKVNYKKVNVYSREKLTRKA